MQSKENQEIDFNKIDTMLLQRHYFDLAAMVSMSGFDVPFMDKMTWNSLSFRPIFQDNISQDAWKSRFLYHWIPKYKYDNIQSEGLYPNGENLLFDYPYRLHLLKSTLNKAKIMNYGRILCDANENRNNDGTYILFVIDLHKLPDDFEIYYDPKFEDGYYCKEPIPIQAIKPINTCNFKK